MLGPQGPWKNLKNINFIFWFRYLESCLHIKTITTKLGQIKSETGHRGGQLVWGSLFIRSRYNTENSRIYIQPEFFLTAKVSSSTTYQINLSVCLSVCAHLEILILKGSPANQSTVWVWLTNHWTVLDQLYQLTSAVQFRPII